MPELPEVETLVFELKQALEHREISGVEIRNDSILETPREEFVRSLPGQSVVNVRRRGKFIRMDLSEGGSLWFHLGMTGQLLLEDPPSSLEPHTHFILSFADSGERLFFRDIRRFGRIAMSPTGESSCPKGVQRLGLEPTQWRREEFATELKGRHARIKNLLLNQHFVAGLGNIYADETLHRAGIHPLRRPERIARHRLVRLHEAMCEVLEEALQWGGSSIDDYLHLDGRKGKFQQFHRVYGRCGARCLTCDTPIRKIRLSGRTSSFCPHCQR